MGKQAVKHLVNDALASVGEGNGFVARVQAWDTARDGSVISYLVEMSIDDVEHVALVVLGRGEELPPLPLITSNLKPLIINVAPTI